MRIGTDIIEIDRIQEAVARSPRFASKVLTAEEEAGQGFGSGNDWQIMTEEEYQAQQAVKKEENSPFAGLQGLFDGDE